MSYYQDDGYGGDEYWDSSYDQFYDFQDFGDYYEEDEYWYDAEQGMDHQEYQNGQHHFDESEHGLYGQHAEHYDDSYSQHPMSSQQHESDYHWDDGSDHHDGSDPEHYMHDMGYGGNYHEGAPEQWYRASSSWQIDRELSGPGFIEDVVRDVEHLDVTRTERSTTRSLLSTVGQKLKLRLRPPPPSVLVTPVPSTVFHTPTSATPSPSSAKELFHSTMWKRSPPLIQQSRSLPGSPANRAPTSHPRSPTSPDFRARPTAPWQFDRGSPRGMTTSSNISSPTQNTGTRPMGDFGFLAPRRS